MMIIDAGLPDGDNLGVAGQLAQRRKEIEALLGDIGGVDTDDCMDVRETLRQRHGATTALETRADGDDAGDAGLGGPRDHPFEIRREIRIVEMGMRLDQIHGKKHLESGTQELRKRKAKASVTEFQPEFRNGAERLDTIF